MPIHFNAVCFRGCSACHVKNFRESLRSPRDGSLPQEGLDTASRLPQNPQRLPETTLRLLQDNLTTHTKCVPKTDHPSLFKRAWR